MLPISWVSYREYTLHITMKSTRIDQICQALWWHTCLELHKNREGKRERESVCVWVREREKLIINSIPYHIISECKKWAILAFHVSHLGIDKGCFDEQNIFKWAFNCNFNISISTWMDGWLVSVWTRNNFF